jgi:maleamate amidohydrolase
MPIWDDLYTPEELAVHKAGGYGAPVGMGERPVLMVIDITYSFTGDKEDANDHLRSVAKFQNSCGPLAWKAIPQVQRLITAARERGVPVIYTRSLNVPKRVAGVNRPKKARAHADTPESAERGNEFTAEIAPRPDLGDIVVEKPKASAFFGTPLLGHLQRLKADHLIISGVSTSGCVRATVYDGFYNNFSQTVVEDCVFDRFPTSHKANLFDMNSKFADVITLDQTLEQLRGVTSWSGDRLLERAAR